MHEREKYSCIRGNFKQMKKLTILFLLTALPLIILSQTPKKEKTSYKTYKPGFYHKEILKGIEKYNNKDSKPKEFKYFALEINPNDYPTDIKKYKKQWHNPPLSQGRSGSCWCFATTSFLESEVKRITEKEVKISEMFTVYWEYVERAKAFIKNRGEVYFAEGSEATSVLRIMKIYGSIPNTAYSGLKPNQAFHDHKKMFDEMNKYLLSVKKSNSWNEEDAIKTIKSILNQYMGKPPTSFIYNGVKYTPKTFLKDCLKLKLDDYFSFMSTLEIAYNQKGELVEADNWWHCDDYYNLNVDDFLSTIINAIENGYSISLCGDVSEPGHDKYSEVGIIPAFDIPSEYIDANSRQFRLSNKTTTDDHCIHLIGYQKTDDGYWFVVKDSGAGGFDGKNKGYRFYHQDYIKLKMMNIMIHKEAANEILNRIIK